jgi:hypothetical protein
MYSSTPHVSDERFPSCFVTPTLEPLQPQLPKVASSNTDNVFCNREIKKQIKDYNTNNNNYYYYSKKIFSRNNNNNNNEYDELQPIGDRESGKEGKKSFRRKIMSWLNGVQSSFYCF